MPQAFDVRKVLPVNEVLFERLFDEKFRILIKIPLKFVPRSTVDNISALV